MNHKVPFDRLLAAQCQIEETSILISDAIFEVSLWGEEGLVNPSMTVARR